MVRRITAGPARRRRLLGIGLVLATALAVVGVPTTATAATSTTVAGVVTAAGKPVAGVPVGFWSRTGHRVVTATTTRSGRFSLRVPARTLGYAYVGTTPGSTKPLFVRGGTTYVRGVIGAARASGIAPALYQGHRSAKPSRLNAGRSVHFRLQRAGRLVVDSAALDGVVLKNLAGATITGSSAQDGVATTPWVVPGRYLLAPRAVAPWRAPARRVQVLPGTHRVAAGAVQGATLTGRLTLPDGGPVLEPVQVDLLQGGTRIASTTSSATGTYSLPVGLAPGTYSLRIGVNPPLVLSELEDPNHAPVRYRSTAQTVVPARDVPVTVTSGDLAPTKDVVLAAAGSVRGTAPGAGVLWLEQADGVMVARGFVEQDGTFAFGGLVPGETYRVIARSGRWVTQDGEQTAWGRTAPITGQAGVVDAGAIALTGEPLTVDGAVTGAESGAVVVTDSTGSLLQSFTRVHEGSWYIASNLVPGVYRVTALVGGVPSTTTTVRVTGDSAQTPATVRSRGAAAHLEMRFTSGSAPARSVFARFDGPGGERLVVYTDPGASGVGRARALRGDDANLDLSPGVHTASAAGAPYSGTSWGAPASMSPWWYAAPSLRVGLKPGQSRTIAVALSVRGG